jgi:hypothetical protein
MAMATVPAAVVIITVSGIFPDQKREAAPEANTNPTWAISNPIRFIECYVLKIKLLTAPLHLEW